MSSLQTPVVHLELHTNDLPSASELYEELCGWAPDRVDTRHGSYLALDLGRRLGGGIVESAAPRPMWLPYVQVGDISRATDRALSPGRHPAARATRRTRRMALRRVLAGGWAARVLAAEALTV